MHKYFFVILILLLGTRILFYYSSQKNLTDGNLRITGQIKSEPLLFDWTQRIEVEGYKIYLPLYPSLEYGDAIIVEGEAKDGSIQKGNVISIKKSNNVLYRFRRRLLDFYKSTLPTDAGALVAGATIGSKALLTSEFWDTLTKTGTAHVVVASGMNVTIISKFLLSVLLFMLPRKKAIPFALLGVWLYAVMAGLGAPIVRATIMGSLTFVSQELGKLGDALRAFFATTWLMLFVKPEWTLDTSFLLSVSATLAIMLLEKPLHQKMKYVPAFIRPDFSTSLAASIGTAPVLFFTFGRISFFSPIINALVLWTVVPITLIGGVAGIVGTIVPTIGKVILYTIYPFTWWFTSVISIFN